MIAFIGVGSNIDPIESINSALRLLEREVRIVALSTFYRTEPVGPPGQPPFVNGVVKIETDVPPGELKYNILRTIEEKTGRVRSAERYAPHTIDLDILVYGDLVRNDDGLVIPDPDIAERYYLAVPLLELAPDLVLPGSGSRLADVAYRFKRGWMEPVDGISLRVK